jgi:hypothetical protein
MVLVSPVSSASSSEDLSYYTIDDLVNAYGHIEAVMDTGTRFYKNDFFTHLFMYRSYQERMGRMEAGHQERMGKIEARHKDLKASFGQFKATFGAGELFNLLRESSVAV